MRKRSNRVWKLPLLMMAMGALLIIGAGAWYLSWVFGDTTEDTASDASAEESYPGISRVSLEEAKAAFDSGAAVFVDVRDVEAYASSHIPGALSMPLEELPSRMNELDPSTWIVTY